jgi:hypothetical protein
VAHACIALPTTRIQGHPAKSCAQLRRVGLIDGRSTLWEGLVPSPCSGSSSIPAIYQTIKCNFALLLLMAGIKKKVSMTCDDGRCWCCSDIISVAGPYIRPNFLLSPAVQILVAAHLGFHGNDGGVSFILPKSPRRCCNSTVISHQSKHS